LILATFAVATTGGTVTHAVFFDAESVSVGVGVEPSEATRVILRDSETEDDRGPPVAVIGGEPPENGPPETTVEATTPAGATGTADDTEDPHSGRGRGRLFRSRSVNPSTTTVPGTAPEPTPTTTVTSNGDATALSGDWDDTTPRDDGDVDENRSHHGDPEEETTRGPPSNGEDSDDEGATPGPSVPDTQREDESKEEPEEDGREDEIRDGNGDV
jgi:hypothetical protein